MFENPTTGPRTVLTIWNVLTVKVYQWVLRLRTQIKGRSVTQSTTPTHESILVHVLPASSRPLLCPSVILLSHSLFKSSSLETQVRRPTRLQKFSLLFRTKKYIRPHLHLFRVSTPRLDPDLVSSPHVELFTLTPSTTTPPFCTPTWSPAPV